MKIFQTLDSQIKIWIKNWQYCIYYLFYVPVEYAMLCQINHVFLIYISEFVRSPQIRLNCIVHSVIFCVWILCLCFYTSVDKLLCIFNLPKTNNCDQGEDYKNRKLFNRVIRIKNSVYWISQYCASNKLIFYF